MSLTLTEVAQQLNSPRTNKKGQVKPIPKVQLIYAFNGSGKTRLSREMKELIAPKNEDDEENQTELSRHKILYYSAFTEDLFYWDNDLDGDGQHILNIQANSFTNWVLEDQGQDQNIITNFQRYANDKLTPRFNEDFSKVSFSIDSGDDERIDNLKISKGEESIFIWSIFYTLLEQAISIIKVAEENERETEQFNQLQYVFIDDPVSSLDENHLIELAQNLATLIKSSPSDGPKFIITTHNPLFYNVLFNALKKGIKYRLIQNEDGYFDFETLQTDSPFSYHLHLLEKLKSAFESNEFEKYHYNLLRNILEKTSTFLGYEDWSDLLPKTSDGTNDAYLRRIVDISSHSKHSGYELSELSQDDKRLLGFLLNSIANKKYEFSQKYQVNIEEVSSNG